MHDSAIQAGGRFAYSVSYTAVCFLPVWMLYRKKIFLKYELRLRAIQRRINGAYR